MIETKRLYYSFGDKAVLKDINLSIPDGTITGLVGINGAGKTTLLRLLAGVYQTSRHCISYDGKSPQLAETRKNIFFLPDDPYYETHTTPTLLFELYKTFYPSIDSDTYLSLLSKYKINIKKHLRSFSKGMRRQVFVALALAVKPKYLLLDEAFDGLDPLSRKLFKDAIIELVESENSTVIISSHSLRELEDFCDNFILIDSNVIKSQGDIAEHIGRLCKFELAFVNEVDKKIFSGLPVVSLEIKGRFVQIVLEGDAEQHSKTLEALSPAVMDEMPLDFEETFIHDVMGKGV